jgi:hypothetical protein
MAFFSVSKASIERVVLSLTAVVGSVLAISSTIVTGAEPPLPDRIEFNRDVRPILSDNCFYCHGPDAGHRQAELRLDIREEALALSAVVPGRADESPLIERIVTDDVDALMPPPHSNKKLSERQKEILKRWIEQGAEYQNHWAYEPVRRPALSEDTPENTSVIDALVQRRLAKAGLSGSSQADRRTLIRRLYSDLIGLPPTPDEVDAFVTDASPEAYSQLVERLLFNQHFGERMAMQWLDVVRFADTIGYHSDNPRNVWPYRDYVIRSFNSNKPFDRFTIEQIAGDLMPDADQETRIGSGFNRLLLSTEEGGAQPKDYEARMMADRVRAIGTVWLGQTTGCAQCHDHKFDPFTMREFYALGAFFADIQEGIIAPREEGMAVMSEEQRTRLAELDAAVATAKQQFHSISSALDQSQKAWESQLAATKGTLTELQPDSKATEAELKTARSVQNALQANPRTPQQSMEIQKYFRNFASAPFADERTQLENAEKVRNEFFRSLPKCLVTKSTDKKRTVRILPRGNWMDETGEVLRPGLPAYLPPAKVQGRELNRLDLAEWLVSRDHPLTARVAMNRLWKQLFGMGLSKVLDDLGAQGEPPVNPELLDYLAAEFMDSGWDFKHMVRLIVLSQTYRQVSTASPELLTADPYNREHARQSPFRVEAELVRDYAMAVSGLLVPTIGGPSVKPYQPDGYWENLNFPTRTYSADTGAGQYRRGLYTWWQRSYLHPSLVAFDAPSREECCAERVRSNIPQQALVLLNDPTYVEASRALATRILNEASGSPTDRIRWAIRTVLQRESRPDELETLNRLYAAHRDRYESSPEAALQLSKIGLAAVPSEWTAVELAAWTHVARVLLNLHETITRS